jgi:hypothetical protein
MSRLPRVGEPFLMWGSGSWVDEIKSITPASGSRPTYYKFAHFGYEWDEKQLRKNGFTLGILCASCGCVKCRSYRE